MCTLILNKRIYVLLFQLRRDMSSKRRPKSHSKSQRKKMKILNSQNFTMETIFDCFPTLSEDIFESLDEESLEKFVEKFHLNPAIRRTQGCILLTYLSVISSKFIQKFAQKCQYFTLIDQSVPLYNFYITFYLRTNHLCSLLASNMI